MQPTASSTNTTTQATCWNGGDNNVSAQLPDGRIAWFYNDSFTGPISYTTNYRNVNGMSFVRNYYALQSVAPEASATWSPMISNGSTTFFQPPAADQSSFNAIFWPNDAITEGTNIQVVFPEIENGGEGPIFNDQIATLSAPNYNNPVYTIIPWGSYTLNGGDGYIYIYDSDGGSGMSVARVPHGSMTTVSAWQWWLGGTSWGAQPATLTTVSGMLSGDRCVERIGPNNYMACGDIWNDMQFAQFPWGPWTSQVSGSPGSNTPTAGPQISVDYYYYFILHKERVNNGVYTIGYCDNGGDATNSAGTSENTADGGGVFATQQKSKCIYAPRYIKTINTLTASPYTVTSFTDTFANSWETTWWQPYGGGIWTVANGVLTFTNPTTTAAYTSILKGLVETNLDLEADVSVNAYSGTNNGSGGVIFRGSNYDNGLHNYNGYSVIIGPTIGAELVRSDGNGSSTVLASSPMAITSNTTYHIKVVANGSDIEAFIGGATSPQLTATDATYPSGGVGVNQYQTLGVTWANFAVNPVSATVPTLSSVASVQSHAGTNYSIALPLTGNPGVECRRVNEDLQIVFTFNGPIFSAIPSLPADEGAVSTVSYSGNTMTVNLTGVSDAQLVTLALANINASTASTDITFGVLLGDINGDGAVNAQDVTIDRNAVESVAGTSGFNPGTDVNMDGAVNAQDVTIVRNAVEDFIPDF
jgi:hypothetical protein